MFSSIAGGNYHGAQLNVRKRFSNGDSIDINYTFSKSIDLRSMAERESYSTGVIWNPWNPGLMKGVSDYDNTHLFNMSGVYNLPFGKGQQFATGDARPVRSTRSSAAGSLPAPGAGPAASRSASTATASGPPTGTTTTGRCGTASRLRAGRFQERFDHAGAVPNMFADPEDRALAAFDPEMPGGIGTRNPIRGDGVFNIDLNVAKRFIMPYRDEKHSIQFRWEIFNLTNTTRFDVYTASLDISTSGTFGKYTDQMGTRA